jgi:hypothetical protein
MLGSSYKSLKLATAVVPATHVAADSCEVLCRHCVKVQQLSRNACKLYAQQLQPNSAHLQLPWCCASQLAAKLR